MFNVAKAEEMQNSWAAQDPERVVQRNVAVACAVSVMIIEDDEIFSLMRILGRDAGCTLEEMTEGAEVVAKILNECGFFSDKESMQ